MLRKTIQILLFVPVLALYIVGNNQIADAETAASVVSRSSIIFDKTYIPQPDSPVLPVIPDGNRPVTKYSLSGQLPRTGEEAGIGLQWLGLGLLIASLSIKIHRKKLGKFKK